MPKILTIGVYGFDEQQFFQALVDHGVTAFCDIRFCRGMRDSLVRVSLARWWTPSYVDEARCYLQLSWWYV